jgi:replicative DNA helicase
MTQNTYEDVYNAIRNLHDEARDKGCIQLAQEIDRYENKEFIEKANAIHH